MRKVHVLVEGQTEEVFVQTVLAPHFWRKNIILQAKIIATKRVKGGSHFKGGMPSYAQVKRDLTRLLHDTSATRVTTMFDFYALPSDFPGQRSKPSVGCRQRVAHLEREFAKDIGDTRFVPHLVLHEFETLVFVDPAACAELFGGDPRSVKQLVRVRDEFQSPEEINEGPDTAPSKRLLKVLPGYQKPLHGPLATQSIGLDPIRRACAHFDGWLETLERI